jgi:hypothetical protein
MVTQNLEIKNFQILYFLPIRWNKTSNILQKALDKAVPHLGNYSKKIVIFKFHLESILGSYNGIEEDGGDYKALSCSFIIKL